MLLFWILRLFWLGYDPFSLGIEQVTVPKVEEEILRNSMIKMRFETAVESGKVKVKAPTKEFSDSAKASASKVGDSFKLSEADMQLLALALELKDRRVLLPKSSPMTIQSRTSLPKWELSFWRLQLSASNAFGMDKVLPRMPQRIPAKLQNQRMPNLRHRTKAKTAADSLRSRLE